MVMLADRLKRTAIAILALAVLVLIRRQVDAFYFPPDVLNIINIFTVVMFCVLIVVMARAWLPGRS
jgi:hypothetical protein